MACPLYKFLKSNGTSFYAFPGSSGDISAAYMNNNQKVYFSHYALLNFPKQNLSVGTNSNPILWDFSNSFVQSINATPPTTYSDQLVESLRNYVANYEVTIKNSKLNNTEYYYDNNILQTPTEQIFWRWCKKMNLIDFELAVDQDEYFANLPEFQRNNLTDNTYLQEYLWKEREVINWDTLQYYQTAVVGYTGKLQITFQGTTNFRVNDIISFGSVSNTSIISNISTNNSGLSINGAQTTVLAVIPAGLTQGQSIIVNLNTTLTTQNETTGFTKLVYNNLVQYVGDVSGVNNVQTSNKSYTEVTAQVPSYAGKTPDILFRTTANENYKPNMIFPILPSQYQPEILGAELFNSPIVNSPQNYPGSYYGQFDTTDFTYETESGDSIRRTGDYYGINGTINNLTVNGKTIDGVGIDFDPSHYAKMNIYGQEVTTFEEFNTLVINNLPPKDFDFNAILWYYTIEDSNGNTSTNLYGITFLDNPDNNTTPSETGLRFPTYKKLVSTDTQDGTSFIFSMNLSYNIIEDNPQDLFNPNAVNSLFSMNLFNDAMRLLGQTNDSFNEVLLMNNDLQQKINNISQLLYTQTDLGTINSKISNLEKLLTLYKTNQIIDSDTIQVSLDTSSSTPFLQFNNIDSRFNKINSLNTTDLYNSSGIIPYNIDVPTNKDFLVYIQNNDETQLTLPNNDVLTVVIDRDLDFKQAVEIIIDSTSTSTQNKQLNVYIDYRNGGPTTTPIKTSLLSNIDLPVYYNTVTQTQNSAFDWEKFDFKIDTNSPIILSTSTILKIPMVESYYLINNSISAGDTLQLKNFTIGTSSVLDFSGQYIVDSISSTSSYINLNISSNPLFTTYGSTSSLPITFNATASYILSNKPYLDINKGIRYRITRIDESDSSTITERYLVEKLQR